MLPQDFWKYKIFEFGLTKAKTDSPCADTKSPFKNQGDYSVYEKTVTHGFKMLNMTLDMYGPATVVEELKDSNTPCCNSTCPEGTKKFYSVDHGFDTSLFVVKHAWTQRSINYTICSRKIWLKQQSIQRTLVCISSTPKVATTPSTLKL